MCLVSFECCGSQDPCAVSESESEASSRTNGQDKSDSGNEDSVASTVPLLQKPVFAITGQYKSPVISTRSLGPDELSCTSNYNEVYVVTILSLRVVSMMTGRPTLVHNLWDLANCYMSQSLQKPTLLDLISSHQNVTSEFGVRVRDKSAVVMSLKLSFSCPLDKKL